MTPAAAVNETTPLAFCFLSILPSMIWSFKSLTLRFRILRARLHPFFNDSMLKFRKGSDR